MLALLSSVKPKQRTPYDIYNVFQIVSVVKEAYSSVFWWGSAWLLEWSEQSTNQYDCSRLLLKRHARACVQSDCYSSAEAALRGTLTCFKTTAHSLCNQPIIVNRMTAEKSVRLMQIAEILMQIWRLQYLEKKILIKLFCLSHHYLWALNLQNLPLTLDIILHLILFFIGVVAWDLTHVSFPLLLWLHTSKTRKHVVMPFLTSLQQSQKQVKNY